MGHVLFCAKKSHGTLLSNFNFSTGAMKFTVYTTTEWWMMTTEKRSLVLFGRTAMTISK